MLFNSIPYIAVFFPLCALIYFSFNQKGFYNAGKIWLFIASLIFYGYWNIQYVSLIAASILFNFYIGRNLQASPNKKILFFGVACNISLLAYYKYTNFLIENVTALSHSNFQTLNIILPLGISFFTFQKIAYLVDSYQGKCREKHLVDFCLFVTFFPQLISGPIVHHQEMMPQFSQQSNKTINWDNVNLGLLTFSIGLFKKTVIADTLASWVTPHFEQSTPLDFIEAWGTSLGYTMQIYFDFSGYTDMAIGSAIIMNINLPENFNSPYRATNIRDFWQRWHITLSRWLKSYLYIPLGGNKNGTTRTCINVLITFLLGGLWHGASWAFVIWGGLHGAATIAYRLWSEMGYRLPKYIGWILTFLFVNIAWIFFRAKDLTQARKILSGMIDMGSIPTTQQLILDMRGAVTNISTIDLLIPPLNPQQSITYLLYLFIAFLICSFPKNSNIKNIATTEAHIAINSNLQIKTIALFSSSIFIIAYCQFHAPPFIYFNF